MQPNVVVAVRRWRSDEQGQDLLEYALLVALIALVAVGAVSSVGDALYTFFWTGIAQNLANVA
jgi:Flp pilus assembly pilin Flp